MNRIWFNVRKVTNLCWLGQTSEQPRRRFGVGAFLVKEINNLTKFGGSHNNKV